MFLVAWLCQMSFPKPTNLANVCFSDFPTRGASIWNCTMEVVEVLRVAELALPTSEAAVACA